MSDHSIMIVTSFGSRSGIDKEKGVAQARWGTIG